MTFGAFSGRPASVNIGAVFTFDSVIGKAAKAAMEMAVSDVNLDPKVLNGTKLKLIMSDGMCNAFLGSTGAFQILEQGVAAIIGPQSSAMAHTISQIADAVQVPLISYAATDPTLSSLQFPLFFRTIQSDLEQMTAMANLIDFYGWKEVIAVYLDDDYGRNGISALVALSIDKFIELHNKFTFLLHDNNKLPQTEGIGIQLESSKSLLVDLICYSGFSVVPHEVLKRKGHSRISQDQKLDNITWPGGKTERPRGWGYCIDIFTKALEFIPYDVPYAFKPVGNGKANPNYDALVKMIDDNIYDAVVGDIAIVTNRTKIVDFSQAFCIIQPCYSGSYQQLVIWILEHRVNDDFHGPPKRQLVTMFMFRPLNTVLRTNPSYTASLTSILTVEQLSSPITGIDRLDCK
ncbi:Receptor, ligand binding region [Sesbania bispinosa]|nr:Receptor, ligand binding region [Sesbania bispinosa]